MHIALRPYVTTGIAIVGAGVIALAPVSVPAPDLGAAEVTCADAVRSVTADVQLTALVDYIAAVPQVGALITQVALQALPLPAQLESLAMALANAGVPAVTETFKLFTETLPTNAQNLIATGKFAHLIVLGANTVYLGTLTPLAPFLVAVIEAMPLPIGGQDGVFNELLKVSLNTPFVAAATVLSLFAGVIDDGLSPVAAVAGTLDAVSVAFGSSAESIGKIVAALGGALPFSVMAKAQGVDGQAFARAVPADPPAVSATMLPPSLNSSTQPGTVDTVTVTVNPSAPPDTEIGDIPPVSTGPDDEPGAEDQSDDDVQDVTDIDETSNGATDVSDGNKAEPADINNSAGAETDDSTTAKEDGAAVDSAVGSQTDTGSDEGSGDGPASGE